MKHRSGTIKKAFKKSTRTPNHPAPKTNQTRPPYSPRETLNSVQGVSSLKKDKKKGITATKNRLAANEGEVPA